MLWDVMLVSHNSRRGSPIGHVVVLIDEMGGEGGSKLTEQSVQLLQSVQSCGQGQQ